jgi:flagellar biosynthesis protein FlhA
MLPIAVVLVVVMMVVPAPSPILDVLIVTNIAVAVLILLVSMTVTRALDFSSFPSLLLIVTLFRLGLNVSTARAVLTRGEAGHVIETFGSVVVGGSLVVGIVIFLILTLVQFVVISNGSGRVAEVGARFTLDAMPGKQMAIDADLSVGAIDEEEARRRRREVADEADFHGAMDGASKFVKGDAIAALVITAVNLIGGFVIGVVQRGMSIGDALQHYSLLTIGDGLVAQVPALLVSISAGLIVTRAAGSQDLGSEVFAQFSRQGIAMRNGGAVVAMMGLVPGMPKVQFFIVGGTLFMLGRRLSERMEVELEPIIPAPVEPEPTSAQQLALDARVEPLALDISLDLVELVDTAAGGDLLDRVAMLRRKLAMELGFVMPAIRTRDDTTLPSHTYVIKVHSAELGRGIAPAGMVLAIGDDLGHLPGTVSRDPVFGLDAKWIPADLTRQAEMSGCTVVDRTTLIVTHLAEVVRRRASRLLSRSDVKALMEGVRESDPAVMDDLVAANITTADVQRVLASLLDDGVAVRDLVSILEAIGERAHSVRTPEALVEAVRIQLGPAITSSLATDSCLSTIVLDAQSEARLAERIRVEDLNSQLDLLPAEFDHLGNAIAAAAERIAVRHRHPVLVCSSTLRPALRRLLKPLLPGVAVVSYPEIGDHLKVEVMDVVSLGPDLNDHPYTERGDHVAA